MACHQQWRCAAGPGCAFAVQRLGAGTQHPLPHTQGIVDDQPAPSNNTNYLTFNSTSVLLPSAAHSAGWVPAGFAVAQPGWGGGHVGVTALPPPYPAGVYSKVGSTSVISADPAVVHYGGFELNRVFKQLLRIKNVSGSGTRIHVIPPTTPFFKVGLCPPPPAAICA